MQSILIVIDMQNEFLYEEYPLGKGKPWVYPIIPRIAKKVAEFKGIVLYTQDTRSENYLETQEGRLQPVIHGMRDTQGWEITNEILSKRDGPIIEKIAFGSPELISYLRELDVEDSIESITIVGVCTDICVISNALMIKAYFPEVEVIIDANCCAGVTIESHENALAAMKSCQVTVINDET